MRLLLDCTRLQTVLLFVKLFLRGRTLSSQPCRLAMPPRWLMSMQSVGATVNGLMPSTAPLFKKELIERRESLRRSSASMC